MYLETQIRIYRQLAEKYTKKADKLENLFANSCNMRKI